MRRENTEILRVDTTVELSGRKRVDAIQMTFRTQEAKWMPWCLYLRWMSKTKRYKKGNSKLEKLFSFRPAYSDRNNEPIL
jgi:hypothetical protein